MKKIFKKLAFFFIALLTLSVGTDYTVNEVKAAESVYKLVNDASDLKVGDKLLIGCSSKGVVAGSLNSGYLSKVAATYNNDSLTSLPSNAIEFTLGGSVDSWTLANSSGKLLGATAVKKVAFGSGTTTWKITFSSGNATIQNTKSDYGRFLYNATSPRFTTYTSNTSSSMLLPQLYKLVENTGGDSGDNENIPLATFVTSTLSLEVGKTETIIANISNYSGNDVVIISEDSTIAKVESNFINNNVSGVVTGVNLGTTNLKVLIDGNDVGANLSVTVGLFKTIDFSEQGYSNEVDFTAFTLDNLITFKGAKGTNPNGNVPKYYSSGTALRFYGGNTLTVSIEKGYNIIRIVLGYGSSDGDNDISANVGDFVNDTWDGKSESVILSISGTKGNRRIKTITVYYEDIFTKFEDSKTYSQLNLNYRYEYELLNETMAYTVEDETTYMKGDNDASKLGLDDKLFDIRGTKISGASDNIVLREGEIRMSHDIHSISINSIYVIDSIKFTSASEEYDSNKINILVNNIKVSSVVEEENKTEKYLINSNSVVISTVGAESAYRFTSLEITYRVPTEYKTFTTADVRYSTIIPSEIALFEGAKFGFNVNVVTSNGVANRSVEVNYSDLILNSDSSYTMAFVFKGIPDFAAEITVNGFVTIGNRTYNFDVCSYKTITSMVKQYVNNAESLGLNAQQIAVLNAFVENQNVTL